MNKNLSIVIVGDFLAGKENEQQFCDGDIHGLFDERICEIIENASYRICNLEGVLSNHSKESPKSGPYKKASEGTIKAYRNLGMDLTLLANNHITDYGMKGFQDTVRVLKRENIDYIGAAANEVELEKSRIISLSGKKIGIYNVAETMFNKPGVGKVSVNLYDEYLVCNDIRQLKSECEYIIALYHGGSEYLAYPSPELKKRFHRMADSGADLIVSQHNHCVGCREIYKGSYLLYGQGNFLFDQDLDIYTRRGLMIELDFREDRPDVKLHLFLNKGGCLAYAEDQTLKDFYDRSEDLSDAKIETEFEKYCLTKKSWTLTGLGGFSLTERLARKLLPTSLYQKYMDKKYSGRYLLRALHIIRSEQNREAAIKVMEMMSENKKTD